MTGDSVTSQEALDMGLVDQVVAKDAVYAAAMPSGGPSNGWPPGSNRIEGGWFLLAASWSGSTYQFGSVCIGTDAVWSLVTSVQVNCWDLFA